MVQLENPEYLYLLILLPVLLFVFLVYRILRRRKLRRFGRPDLLPTLMPMASGFRPWFRFGLYLLATGSLVVAAVNPRVGSRMEEAKREGIDIVVALDVSRSMLAEDIKPNRLERARLAVIRLIDRLDGDRFGLVVFAGNAVTQVPLTTDHHAAKMLTRTVSTNSVQVQGTAIGTAIERAMAAFSSDDLTNKVLIIVSDGENHLDDPVEVARRAHQRGLTIHTVGVGTPAGAPIPLIENGQLTGFLRDNSGNTVVSRFDEATLREIARVGGGIFTEGRGADMGLGRIIEEIRAVEKEEFDLLVFADFESRYHYFVAMALLLFLAELIISNKKSRRLQQLRLFTPEGQSKWSNKK